MGLGIGLAVALSAAGAAQAGTAFVNLGPSAEDFTLYGQGAIAPGIGSYTIGQGASTFDGTTSTFTLSGTISSGTGPYGSGTYQFVTTYLGADSPDGGPNAPVAQANPSDTEEFFYDSLAPSTQMTLFLDTPSKDYAIPLVVNGNFVPNSGFSFGYVSTQCTGIAVCDQAQVGLTPGSSIFGPVTISASFAVPEPAVWAMMLLGFGAIGGALRMGRRRSALAES
jgi:hypothetical protein